jgi:hypothetical protein
MPQIKAVISREGDVNMEGFGFVGRNCDAVMDPIIRALGKDPAVADKHYKPEALTQDEGEQLYQG